jgi:hypothetical protein
MHATEQVLLGRSAALPYCIYTDTEHDDAEMNEEHVVPRSLGGADAFTIRVSRAANKELGTAVDGKLANDFLMMFRRERFDARGHSGRPPTPVVKKASLLDGRPIQVSLARTGLEVWAAREGRVLKPAEMEGRQFDIKVDMQLDPPMRFLAKVALGTGQFLFGDEFHRRARTQDLRHIMTHGEDDAAPPPPEGMSARVDCMHFGARFEMDRTFLEDVCQLLVDSCVITVVRPEEITLVVGILGKYLGLMTVAADTHGLTEGQDFEGGHILQLRGNRMLRGSMRRLREILEARSTP